MRRQTLAASCLLLVVAGGSAAGLGRGQWAVPEPARRASAADAADPEGNVPNDGRFVFVRLRYQGTFGRGFRREPPWAHDYPRAERNFMRILRDITFIEPQLDASNVLTLDDPELGSFPLAYMSEPGYWTLTDEEALGLRNYLLKGGFLIFDDFRGWDLNGLENGLHAALPDARLVELASSHPVFHSFFEIEPKDFIPMYDETKPVFYGVFEDNDPSKRLMAIANYNNDIGEYWEYSDTGYVPIDLSNEAYKFGVNYVVYAMTH